MISLEDPSPAAVGYWAARPAAYAVTLGRPAGLEEIAVCEHRTAADWHALAHRHDPKDTS